MSTSETLSPLRRSLALLRGQPAQERCRFVGIDIGVEEISFAALSLKASRNKSDTPSSLQWRTDYRFATGIDPLSPPSPEWITKTIEALVNKMPRCVDGTNSIAAITLPLPWVHHQVVLGTELESSQTQCDAMFGHSMFQSRAHLTHWPIVGLQHGQPNEDDQYIVAATSETAAYQIAQAVQSIGYRVESILPHGVALVQAAVPLTAINAQCVVHINRAGGMVAMSNGSGCGICRALPAVPAQVIRDSGDSTLLLDDVRPWLSDIAAEINATIRFADRANMQRESQDPILICGDIVGISDVDVVLAKLTNRPIATWTYRGRSRPNRRNGSTTSPTKSDKNTGDWLSALPLSLAYHASSLAGKVST